MLKPDSQTIHLPGVGPVLFTRSRRARRISIVLKPFQAVRVTVPAGVPLPAANRFLEDHLAWVQRKQSQLRILEEHMVRQASPPAALDRQAAASRIIVRLQELAERHGFSYGKVTIRCQKTRWGSCSARNNLSLNVKLAALPPELLDLVLLHELVHTRIKHHGPEFWEELERLAGQAREKSARLRRYHLALL